MFHNKRPNHITPPQDETREERQKARENLREMRSRVEQLEAQADVMRRAHPDAR
jgi:hypothetical protein